MPINGHGQNMLSGANNGLLSVCVNNATSATNAAKVCTVVADHFSLCLKFRRFSLFFCHFLARNN